MLEVFKRKTMKIRISCLNLNLNYKYTIYISRFSIVSDFRDLNWKIIQNASISLD